MVKRIQTANTVLLRSKAARVYHIRETGFRGDLAKLAKKENRPTTTTATAAVKQKRKFCIQTFTLCVQTKAKGLSKLCTSSVLAEKRAQLVSEQAKFS